MFERLKRLLCLLLLPPACGLVFLPAGCDRSGNRPGPPPVLSFYRLPEAHPDNAHPLKSRFFDHVFHDLSGAEITLGGFRGTAVVVLMFPSFRTDAGRQSLVMLERVHRMWPDRFQAVVVPVEDADTVRPAIVSDPENMWFLFSQSRNGNSSLPEDYADLFWDRDTILADFPGDPVERHRASPFFWVVDREGVIREKLIDYSASRGVRLADLEEVLTALLGAPESELQPEDKGSDGVPASTAGTEESAR